MYVGVPIRNAVARVNAATVLHLMDGHIAAARISLVASNSIPKAIRTPIDLRVIADAASESPN
jgi:hypothetical protein